VAASAKTRLNLDRVVSLALRPNRRLEQASGYRDKPKADLETHQLSVDQPSLNNNNNNQKPAFTVKTRKLRLRVALVAFLPNKSRYLAGNPHFKAHKTRLELDKDKEALVKPHNYTASSNNLKLLDLVNNKLKPKEICLVSNRTSKVILWELSNNPSR